MSSKPVVCLIELGHKATARPVPTANGFTHDWEVFVQGVDGAKIETFVDKVVFLLHESFENPKKVIKVPPYRICEQGYGGFILPIEIYYRTNEEPRSHRYAYDLFLHSIGQPPVNHIRREKIVFHRPSDDFRRKLLKGGGGPCVNLGGEDGQIGVGKTTVSKPSSGAKIKPAQPQSTTDIAKRYKHEPKKEMKVKAKLCPFQRMFGEPIIKITELKPVKEKPPKEKSPKEKEKVLKDKTKDKQKDKEKLDKSDINKTEKPPEKEKKIASKTLPFPEKDKEKDKDRDKKSSSKDKHKDRSSSTHSVSSSVSSIPGKDASKEKEKTDKEKHRKDKERDKHRKDRDKDRDKSHKEGPKRSLSPTSSIKSDTSTKKKKIIPSSPASSVKSDSSTKKRNLPPEIPADIKPPIKVQEITKEKKKDKKREKKEKRKDKELSLVDKEKEKLPEKIVSEKEVVFEKPSSLKMEPPAKVPTVIAPPIPIIKEMKEKSVKDVYVKEKKVTEKQSKEIIPVNSSHKKESKSKAQVKEVKEKVAKVPIVQPPSKERKLKSKPVPVVPPPRSRSSSKSSLRSISPSLSISPSPSPPSRSSSTHSQSPIPTLHVQSPSHSRSKSRSLSRSSSASRRSLSRSLSHSKSISPSRSPSPSHSRSHSRSRSRSRSCSRSQTSSHARSQVSSHGRSRSPSRSVSRSRSLSRSRSQSPTGSVSSSTSASSNSQVSINVIKDSIVSIVPPPQASAAALPGKAVRPDMNPLGILMQDVNSSSSDSEEHPTEDPEEPRSPVGTPRHACTPNSQLPAAIGTPRKVDTPPVKKCDTPPVKPVSSNSRKPDTPTSKSTVTRKIDTTPSTTPRPLPAMKASPLSVTQSMRSPMLSSDEEEKPLTLPNRSSKRETSPRKGRSIAKKKRRSVGANNSCSSPEVDKVMKLEDKFDPKSEIKEETIMKSELNSLKSEDNNIKPEINEAYLAELQELHRKIMNSVDREKLQKVVDIIAEHASFQVTQSHFNFDLFSLDAKVVTRLQDCFL